MRTGCVSVKGCGCGCGWFGGFDLFDRRVIVVFDKEGVDFECDFD